MAYNFINPYNFIPLTSKCRREFVDNNECYTGYMKCQLETKTPLIMLDTDSVKYVLTSKQEEGIKSGEIDIKDIKKEDMHKVYTETYKIDGKPAIPGSELRGMIRSKFEALTSSCMSSVEEDLSFSSRYKGAMNKAGILDLTDPKDVKLYECDKIVVDSYKGDKRFEKYRSGDFVKFEKKDRYKNGKKLGNNGFKGFSQKGIGGYIRKGESCAGKEAIHIFINTGREVEAENKKKFYGMFLVSKDNTNENLGRPHVALVKDAINLDKYSTKSSKEIMQPVWYEEVDGKVYFSIGQNGQVKYDNELKELVPEDFRPCKDKDNLCEACRVFGFVSGDNSINGKVRISDALMELDDEEFYDSIRTLQELSSPRYENARFYMSIRENGRIVNTTTGYNWTADFKSKFKGGKNGTESFGPNESVMIRGRKEYWHHDPQKMNGYNTVEKTKRNITVRPVEGTYIFYVYFNNLTKEQLEHLNMAVSLGNTYDNKSDYAHKLGHGKPLGYGSVKVKVNDIELRELKKEDSVYKYSVENYVPEYNELFELFKSLSRNPGIKDAIDHMYSFGYLTEKIGEDNKHKPAVQVDYPRMKPEGDIYEWFGNRAIKNVLPFSNQEYDKLVLVGEKSQGYNGKRDNRKPCKNNYNNKSNSKNKTKSGKKC